MVPCPLCLADHELTVRKVLGSEKHKGHEVIFFGNYLGRFLFCCFLVVMVFYCLYVPQETLWFVIVGSCCF